MPTRATSTSNKVTRYTLHLRWWCGNQRAYDFVLHESTTSLECHSFIPKCNKTTLALVEKRKIFLSINCDTLTFQSLVSTSNFFVCTGNFTQPRISTSMHPRLLCNMRKAPQKEKLTKYYMTTTPFIY